MTLLLTGVLTGILATLVLDAWAAFVKHVLKLPTANWGLVGRWFGHMGKGRFVHRPIAASAPIANEIAIGWIGHYAIGVAYGIAYLAFVQCLLSREPTLTSGVVGSCGQSALAVSAPVGATVISNRSAGRSLAVSTEAGWAVAMPSSWHAAAAAVEPLDRMIVR